MSTQFYEEFEKRIASIVVSEVEMLLDEKLNSPSQRGPLPEVQVLNKKEAIKYIGGMDNSSFKQVIASGLKRIVFPTGTTGSIKYDKKDLDAYLEEHKIWVGKVYLSPKEQASILLEALNKYLQVDFNLEDLYLEGLIEGVKQIEEIVNGTQKRPIRIPAQSVESQINVTKSIPQIQ